MAHAHTRTLLAKMGFGDPDKKHPRHDLGCQYLAQPHVATRLCLAIIVPILHDHERDQMDDNTKIHVGRALELPVEKGEGQYKTTIGFMDLQLNFQLLSERPKRGPTTRDRETGAFQMGEIIPGEWSYSEIAKRTLCIEVKATPTTHGEILRQINLYRSFPAGRGSWAVATTFPLAHNAVDALKSERINHLVLGADFEAWCVEQEAAPKGEHEASMEI